MYNCKTLFTHLFVSYIKYFSISGAVLIAFFCVTNTFDVIQKFKDFQLPFISFLELILYKIPFLLNEVVPLVSLISMIFFLNKLIKHNELIVILCNGLSFWRVLLIPSCANLMLGIFFLYIITPFSTYSLHKLARIENRITKKQDSLFFLNSSFLFFEKWDNENRIIRAESINFDTSQLNNVIILFMDSNNDLIKRIDAKTAEFGPNILKLHHVKLITYQDISNLPQITINTNLSVEYFTQRLMPPEKISIWELPNIINKFFKSGLTTVEYKTYYYRQIFKPYLMISMAILGGCFVNISNKNNLQVKIATAGLICGVTTFLLLEVILKILVYNGINPIFAILLPNILIILISNFVILHFHEA